MSREYLNYVRKTFLTKTTKTWFFGQVDFLEHFLNFLGVGKQILIVQKRIRLGPDPLKKSPLSRQPLQGPVAGTVLGHRGPGFLREPTIRRHFWIFGPPFGAIMVIFATSRRRHGIPTSRECI